MIKKKNGFTLIELLVVISIIALLLSILMPALSKVKEQAKAVVCMSNVKQWVLGWSLYTTDNDDKFPIDPTGAIWGMEPEVGTWMYQIAEYYGDIDELRVCPSAKQPALAGSDGWGSADTRWGPSDEFPANPWLAPFGKYYGSYGTNQWIYGLLPGGSSWIPGMEDVHWRKIPGGRLNDIPLMGDSTWYGGLPTNIYTSGNDTVPTGPEWHEEQTGGLGALNMGRFAINRHNKNINMAFMDYSVRKVYLPDLWTLEWHKGIQKPDDVMMEDIEDTLSWIR